MVFVGATLLLLLQLLHFDLLDLDIVVLHELHHPYLCMINFDFPYDWLVLVGNIHPHMQSPLQTSHNTEQGANEQRSKRQQSD